MSQSVGYYTQEGLQKLKDELHHLKVVERKSATQAVVEAREKGDLSENAENDAAREAQALLEVRIAKLEEEKALRKTLKSNLNMYEDAIKKLEPIYSGNLFLEESYKNAENLRDQTLAKLAEID